MTALDGLIRRALRMSGGLGTGQIPNVDESADALLVLNSMVDGWNTNRINIYQIARTSFTLVPNQPSYTIGLTGNINIARPQRIEHASIILSPLSTLPIEIPLHMIRDEREWQNVSIKAIPSPIPVSLYNDGAFPLSNLYLYPVANQANALVLYCWQPLAAFAAVTDVVTFPPGYADAIAYNLGVRISVEWGRTLNDPEVKRLARETLFAIQQDNTSEATMRCDPAATSTPGRASIFNWYNRETR